MYVRRNILYCFLAVLFPFTTVSAQELAVSYSIIAPASRNDLSTAVIRVEAVNVSENQLHNLSLVPSDAGICEISGDMLTVESLAPGAAASFTRTFSFDRRRLEAAGPLVWKVAHDALPSADEEVLIPGVRLQ